MMNAQRSQRAVQKIGRYFCILFLLFAASCMQPAASDASEKWQGVDESVVEKYAKAQGREAHKPLINTDQGDLLLFVFLIAGTAGGFAAGYYWRMLITERAPVKTREHEADKREGNE